MGGGGAGLLCTQARGLRLPKVTRMGKQPTADTSVGAERAQTPAGTHCILAPTRPLPSIAAPVHGDPNVDGVEYAYAPSSARPGSLSRPSPSCSPRLPALHLYYNHRTDPNMPDELAPPRKSVELEDPGARELGTPAELPPVMLFTAYHACSRFRRRALLGCLRRPRPPQRGHVAHPNHPRGACRR